MIASGSPAFEAAWRAYYDSIEELRRKVYAVDWIDRPGARNGAHYYMLQVQATAFNMAIGPRRDYPTFSLNLTYAPILYSLSNHSADFNLRFGLVDGSRSYRLWGRRNGALFLDVQINNVLWGMANPRKLGNYDIDNFVRPDGTFELILSATEQPGNWVRIDPQSQDNLVLLREVFDDWDKPRAEIHLTRIDDGQPGRLELDEAELIRRLDIARRYIHFYVWDWSCELTTRMLAEAGTNVFHHGIFAADQGAGNNPAARYPGAVYDMEGDEALVLECEAPRARYWNVQLADPLWQVTDFTYHFSSINNRDAHVGKDGRFRAIVSRQDPGIANWLDPVDNPFGIMLFRIYGADKPVSPEISFRGSLAEALSRMPADTPRIMPQKRTELLARRTAAARRRFQE